jgi:hypothetical protein
MSTDEYKNVCREYIVKQRTSGNYWVFGFGPSLGILETIKYHVSETGSVSILGWGEATNCVGSLRKS